MSAPPPYPQDYTKLPLGYPPPQYNVNGVTPPHAPGFHLPPPQNQPQMVYVTTPALGPHTARITCSNCHREIETSTYRKPSIMAWISAGALCFFGCVFGCFLIPFFLDSCKDTHHSCPICQTHQGSHRAF